MRTLHLNTTTGVITFQVSGSVSIPTPDDNGVAVLDMTIESAGNIDNTGSPDVLAATSGSFVVNSITRSGNNHADITFTVSGTNGRRWLLFDSTQAAKAFLAGFEAYGNGDGLFSAKLGDNVGGISTNEVHTLALFGLTGDNPVTGIGTTSLHTETTTVPALNSQTVGGLTLNVGTTPPAMGTSSDIITFVMP